MRQRYDLVFLIDHQLNGRKVAFILGSPKIVTVSSICQLVTFPMRLRVCLKLRERHGRPRFRNVRKRSGPQGIGAR